jgi:2-isopropylmalate synthase
MVLQPHKAIVGKNAFRHSSGIHQDGVLKMRETYEIMDPARSASRGDSIVLTKVSGRHACAAARRARLRTSDEEFDRIFAAFKELADKKDEVDDRDLRRSSRADAAAGRRDLDARPGAGGHGPRHADGDRPAAGPDGSTPTDAAVGTGPVDAIYRAINRVTGVRTS